MMSRCFALIDRSCIIFTMFYHLPETVTFKIFPLGDAFDLQAVNYLKLCVAMQIFESITIERPAFINDLWSK
jgi:hypothetical protein